MDVVLSCSRLYRIQGFVLGQVILWKQICNNPRCTRGSTNTRKEQKTNKVGAERTETEIQNKINLINEARSFERVYATVYPVNAMRILL